MIRIVEHSRPADAAGFPPDDSASDSSDSSDYHSRSAAGDAFDTYEGVRRLLDSLRPGGGASRSGSCEALVGAGSVLSRQRSCAGASRPLPPVHLYGAPVKPFCCQGETVAFYLFYLCLQCQAPQRHPRALPDTCQARQTAICNSMRGPRVYSGSSPRFWGGSRRGPSPMSDEQQPPVQDPAHMHVHYQAAPQLVVGSPPQCGFNAAARLVTPHFRAGGEH